MTSFDPDQMPTVALMAIEQGSQHPFDGRAAQDAAHRAALGVLADLSSRTGVGEALQALREDWKTDVVTMIAEIVRQATLVMPSFADQAATLVGRFNLSHGASEYICLAFENRLRRKCLRGWTPVDFSAHLSDRLFERGFVPSTVGAHELRQAIEAHASAD